MKDQEIKFQEFSIKEYIFIIRLHLKKILFFTIIGFCIGFLLHTGYSTLSSRHIVSIVEGKSRSWDGNGFNW